MSLAIVYKYRCMTCEGMPFLVPTEDLTRDGYQNLAVEHLTENPTHELSVRICALQEESP